MKPRTTWLIGCLMTLWFAGAGMAQPAVPGPSLPPLPTARSPVELFRRLIAATPEEAAQLLEGRTPEQRKVILAKIEEYRITPPPLREWRLKATELRWYLTPLMRVPPESRGALLLAVPESDRPLVEARLQQWDQLSATEKQELLNNELALKYVARPANAPAPNPDQLKNLPPAVRAQLEQAIDQWRAMPEAQRQTLSARFASFFSLTPTEQGRTLDLLTASERDSLTRTIGGFASLNPAERERSLQGLRQFSRMSREERLAFLQGAERWKSLPDEQKANWRKLVTKLPPLPPGAGLPPLPPGFKPAPPGAGPMPAVDDNALVSNAR